MMTGFRTFVETAASTEVQATLKKLPPAHQKLAKGYRFKFQDGCILKGYPDAIGLVHINNDKKREIHVAAPWN